MLRVLIVDDSEPVRRGLALLLAALPGVEIVGQATSVAESLAAIRRLAPDAVTLDMHLPDGNGLEVLRRTRRHRRRPAFIVLTTFPRPEHEAEAARHKVLAVLDKTRDAAKLVKLIRRLAKPARSGGGRKGKGRAGKGQGTAPGSR